MDMRLGLGVVILLAVLVVLARVATHLRPPRTDTPADDAADPATRWLTAGEPQGSAPDAPSSSRDADDPGQDGDADGDGDTDGDT